MMPSFMAQEIAEIPEAAERLCAPSAQADFATVAAHLRQVNPRAIGLIAHGSSRHAGAVLADGLWHEMGLPVYRVPFPAQLGDRKTYSMQGHLVIGISQSGGSPDLITAMAQMRAAGAETVALSNTMTSPLVSAARHALDLCAGPEHAVAATKSFVNSVLAAGWLRAHVTGDATLKQALAKAPEALARAYEQGPDPRAIHLFSTAKGLFVLGRGASLGIAEELALKAMELCGIHATAFSGGDVLHGPSAIATNGFPVLSLAGDGISAICQTLSHQGANCLTIKAPPNLSPRLDGLLQLVPLYRALEVAARNRGRDPDHPAFLQKLTRTV